MAKSWKDFPPYLFTPFWKTDVMEKETITFHEENGQITGKLLFAPKEILTLTDWRLKTEYLPGKDYLWEKGSQTITLPAGSSIPFFKPGDLAGEGVEPWNGTFDSLGRSRFGYAVYCVSEFIYGRQLAVTYTYNRTDFKGETALPQLNLLPRTAGRLARREPLRIVFYGDSIFSGCDASSMYNREPFQPYLHDLVRMGLEKKYGSPITMLNPSVGGKDSNWGRENAQTLAADEKPDLVIIGLGQNDGPWGGAATRDNVRAIMDTVRETEPSCEFLVVASLKPNENAGFLMSQSSQPAFLKELAGPGCAYANMYSLHEYLLASKYYADLTGNNINHPNDFFIRIYAGNILSALEAV